MEYPLSSEVRMRMGKNLDPLWKARVRDVWERAVMVCLNAGDTGEGAVREADVIVEAWGERFAPGELCAVCLRGGYVCLLPRGHGGDHNHGVRPT